MKIEVDISDHYAQVLAKWASVGRTLRTAESCCGEAGNTLDPADREKYHFCGDELNDLIPALEHLHMQARDRIWAINRRKRTFEELSKTTIEQRRIAKKYLGDRTNPHAYDVANELQRLTGMSRECNMDDAAEWLRSLDENLQPKS